jgi:hypothetical protein
MRESQILNESYAKWMAVQHPTMPVHAYGKASFKMTKNKETVILDKITKFLRWEGQLGVVVDSAGHYSKQAGMYIKSKTTIGCSDIIACINSHFYAIELKRIYDKGKDVQSEHQKKFEHRVGEALGVYVIVNDFMNFYEWYKTII